jgi:mono/diheme cytochrome c family protein
MARARAYAGVAITVALVRAALAGPLLARDPQDGTAAADVKAALMDEGQFVYGTNCLECHSHGTGPDLSADAHLSNRDKVVTRILQGSDNGDMSEFASTLTDREIAAVATYVRNAFDNTYGVVLEEVVRTLRQQLAKKK